MNLALNCRNIRKRLPNIFTRLRAGIILSEIAERISALPRLRSALPSIIALTLLCANPSWSDETEQSGLMNDEARIAAFIEKVRWIYLEPDSDKDGITTPEESKVKCLSMMPESFTGEAARGYAVFCETSALKHDLNKDGLVTAEEFGKAMYLRTVEDFTNLDVDRDGELSFVEVIHPTEGKEGGIIGMVSGTSFRFGATNEEVASPHGFIDAGKSYDANFSAYVGHAFARWDKDESFTLSFDEFAGL